MRVVSVAASLILGSVVGCLSSADPTLSGPLDSWSIPTWERRTLWETSPERITAAVKKYVQGRRQAPDRMFVPLKVSEGEVVFGSVPSGWYTWEDGKSAGRVIVLDDDGFRVLIKLRRYSSADHPGEVRGDDALAKKMGCFHAKGDTDFSESRRIRTPYGVVEVELIVIDVPERKRTLRHLLDHLDKHYGKYEGVCENVRLLPSP